MRIWTGRNRDRRATARAFTLVELLVVITVIGLLVGIFVGAVGQVRKQARNTKSSALIGSLATGLETFKADGRIGGGYPPSWSDQPTTSGNFGEVRNPYAGGSSEQNFIEITGAGLLVWAMAGADLLGTPGFKPFRGPTLNPLRLWSADTDDDNNGDNPTQSGAYALRADGRTLQPRSGPYLDLSRVKLSEWDVATRSFPIPAEQTGGSTGFDPDRDYPMFLDGFGFPVLYWKADPAGVALADESRYQQLEGAARGIYHHEDNWFLVDTDSDYRLVLRGGASEHKLDWDNGSYNVENPPPVETFNRYILNEGVQARLSPRRADSYLLVTPGADGVYGTADDVANFEHNGR